MLSEISKLLFNKQQQQQTRQMQLSLSLSLSLSFRAIVQCGNSSLLQKQCSGRMMRVVVVVVDVVGRVVRAAREAAKRKV